MMVQINDKSMNIGIQGNFGTLISNQSGPTLDFAQEGSNLQSKMADIENVNFSYIFKQSGQKAILKVPNAILIVYIFIHDIAEYFQIQDGRQIQDL